MSCGAAARGGVPSPTSAYHDDGLPVSYLSIFRRGGIFVHATSRFARIRRCAAAGFSSCNFAIIGLMCIPALGVSRAQEDVDPSWRTAANSGINSLYCYLRIHNHPCSYTDLLQAQRQEHPQGATALFVMELADKNGLPLQLVSLTKREFDACPLPMIVAIDLQSPDQGAFNLVLGRAPGVVLCMDGATAMIQKVPAEDFLRAWSGMAFVPRPARARPWILIAAFLIGCAPCLLYFRRTITVKERTGERDSL